MCIITNALLLYNTLIEVNVNFKKIKLLSVEVYALRTLLWTTKSIKPYQMVRHLGYPLGKNIIDKLKVNVYCIQ